MNMQIRAPKEGEAEILRALNNTAVPHVNDLSPAAFAALADMACYIRVAEIDGQVAGLILTIGEGQEYQSQNYRWFSANCKDFVYIDRVIVAEEFRGRGIAKAFYNDIAEFSAASAKWIACEVNINPPNPESVAFHSKFGFYEVGQQDTENGTKRVSVLIKNLHADDAPCSLRKVA